MPEILQTLFSDTVYMQIVSAFENRTSMNTVIRQKAETDRQHRQSNKQTNKQWQDNHTIQKKWLKLNIILLCSYITVKRNADITNSLRSGVKRADSIRKFSNRPIPFESNRMSKLRIYSWVHCISHSHSLYVESLHLCEVRWR